ncbi:MAG TPA: efflux RND transporter periplasmic adaptor subunit [Thermoanaerobaculia bacterium]|nr:efflux RND transporter periplasmic adaptor subunit [Thermoanaerobaculia bacterium]
MTSKSLIEGSRTHRGRLFALTGLLPVVLAVACGDDAATQIERPTVTAATTVVEAAAVPSVRAVAGTVVSSNVSPLASRVVGNVVRVLVSEGDAVRAGQTLVEIDAREGRAQIDRARAGTVEIERSIDAAQANATLADTTLARYNALFERRAVSAQELDDVKARRDSAAAELARLVAKRGEVRAMSDSAQIFLDDSSVRSPIDGVVTRRFVDPGAQAAPGMTLVTVEDARSFRVEASVPEGTRANPGDPVTVQIGSSLIEGRIANVQPGVDPTSRSALVKIILGETTLPLRSGTYARVLIPTGTREALTVPASAIVRRGQLSSVFVVGEDNVARMRLITLGENNEVLSGLESGERIVVDPSKVTDGARIAGGASGA